ncbi:MAG: hypothetical protein GXO90_10035 [FCB group bacterium]|nr:hypothetical protein [FCB group bacterium]
METLKQAVLFTGIMFTLLFGGKNPFSIFAEAKAGPFKPRINDYMDVYPELNLMGTLKIGVGASGGFLVGRYSYFLDRGASLVRGIAVDGDAVWEERIASVGIRSYQKPFYLELMYVSGWVKESISTRDPIIDALSTTFHATDVRGYAIGAGFIVPLIAFLNLNIGAEYLHLPLYRDPARKKDQVNIGGYHVSAGIMVKL